ncbi:hypothetical protein ACRQ5Q_24590 [Bradyrhizobium sp. PMVTL-01]|uniref:hypothetical protein n=1 Tax=Bradyrhizobium sp. PMVTL-01 TaxID=3434999 RepID=UPI003F6F64BB
MQDIVERLRYWLSDNPACVEAADEIERLRDALRPFADYYDLLERNGYLDGYALVSMQGDAVLGHAGVQARDLKAAKEALS